MSITEHSRFDELMSRYLDASLEDAEERELLQCLLDEGLAARFHVMTSLDTEIAGILAGSIANEVMVGLVLSDLPGSAVPISVGVATSSRTAIPVPINVRRAPKRQTGLLLALAALVIGLLGVAAFYFSRSLEPAVRAQIVFVRGETYFSDKGQQTLLSTEHAVRGDGTVKTVGPGSRATLKLPDGTRIELLGETLFTLSEAAGERRYFLERGAMRCSVARQSTGAPVVFDTPGATATVHGTDLALYTAKNQTLLVVTQGTVAFRRSPGGAEVLVEAGFYSRIEEDGKYPPRSLAWLPKIDRERVLSE